MARKADQIVDDAIAKLKAKKTELENRSVAYGLLFGASEKDRERVKTELAGIDASIYVLEVGRHALNTYISQEAEPIKKQFDRLVERFEVLDGTRSNKALGQRAVRFDNIRSIANVPSQPAKSRKTAKDTPSKEDFNALFDDVRTLYQVLFDIGVAIRSHGTSK